MWRELVGTWAYAAGASGTVTIPKGAMIVQIVAIDTAGGGTVVIFGGTAIPITPAVPLVLRFNHDLCNSKNSAQDIVFTGTDSYFIEYVKAGNT